MLQMITLFGAWAQEVHTEEPSGIDLVLPEATELYAGIVAFGIVFVVVWIWVRPKMSALLAARQEAITGQLTAAENAKLEAQSLLDDYKQQLATAKDEANRIVDDARQAAEAVKVDVVARAETEAATIRSKAQEDAASEKDRATAQIRDEVASLSLALAQKVVAGSVDESTQRALVDRYIDDLGGLEA